jgi:hypothetical protein
LDEQSKQQLLALHDAENEEEEGEEEEEGMRQPEMLALPSVPGEGEGSLTAVDVSGIGEATVGALVQLGKKKKRKQGEEVARMKLSFCEHIVAGSAPSFAHHMCRECFIEYLRTSGGVYQV